MIVLSANSSGDSPRVEWEAVNLFDRITGRVGTATNIGLGLVFAAILVADTVRVATHGGNWAFELAVGAILGALAFLRNRNRTRAAVAGLVASGAAAVVAGVAHLPSQPGFAATVALLVLGAACMRTAAPLPAAAVALAGAALMVAGRAVVVAGAVVVRPTVFPLLILGVLSWGGAVGVGLWLRYLDARRRDAVDAARRDERLELARELHDVVAHHITGIVIQAQAASLVGAKHPETLPSTLAGIESSGTDALAAMRRVIGLLRSSDDAGGRSLGPEQLRELVARFADRGPAVEVHLPSSPSEPPWPPEVTTAVYRVVQEALTNVARHAPTARTVAVIVSDTGSGVTVEVTDDAPTGPSWFDKSGGYGLVGMRERVEALDGTLSAGPCPDGGWIVRAALPLTARSAT